MKRLWSMALLGLLVISCNAQEKKAEKKEADNHNPQPQVKWDVKKEYDDQGNLIRYDSVYTWTYTNTAGDSVVVPVDSVLQHFETFFNSQWPSIWDEQFMQPMWADSLLYKDFGRPDYFYDRWQEDFFRMEEMFRRMDSLRNRFLEEQYPGLHRQGTPYPDGVKKS